METFRIRATDRPQGLPVDAWRYRDPPEMTLPSLAERIARLEARLAAAGVP